MVIIIVLQLLEIWDGFTVLFFVVTPMDVDEPSAPGLLQDLKDNSGNFFPITSTQLQLFHNLTLLAFYSVLFFFP